MDNPTCLYCDVVFVDVRQRVCADHRAHHRRVLHFARQDKLIPTATCQGCASLLANTKAKWCRPCRKKENARIERERKAARRPDLSARVCEWCEVPLATTRRSDARFCGRTCIENWRGANVDRSEWRRSYRATATELQRKWRSVNPATVAGYKSIRRARERRGVIAEADWKSLLNRAAGRCTYCGERRPLTMEHVVPLSRGGSHSIGNVTPVCSGCNSSKGGKLLIEWRGRRRALEALRAA